MRGWSVAFGHLDWKGLNACWNEAGWIRDAIRNPSHGCYNHSQMIRWKQADNAKAKIHRYLYELYQESLKRGYDYDESQFDESIMADKYSMTVTTGQLEYEYELLRNKLDKDTRGEPRITLPQGNQQLWANPLFALERGGIADWERNINLDLVDHETFND